MIPVYVADLTAVGGNHYLLRIGPIGVRLARPHLAALRRCLQGLLADHRAGAPIPCGAADTDGASCLAYDGSLTVWWPNPAQPEAEVVLDYDLELVARMVEAIDAALYGPVEAAN